MITKMLIEQHFHGAYGIDFNKATVSDILDLAFQIKKDGIGIIFPTLVTDTIENTIKQIKIIKQASFKQTNEMAQVMGVHLEGIFLNPLKKGIHNSNLFLEPTVENFELINGDNFIKIITIAPELVKSGNNLLEILKTKGIKIQAGHCIGGDLTKCDGTTHTFNAMSGITHREKSTTLSALINDELYSEIIPDGIHVFDDALKLLFKCKPSEKIILISDCLPCTRSHLKEFEFAGEKIFYDGNTATSKEGTLAGSTKLLPDIIKILGKKNLFNPGFIDNAYTYHGLDNDEYIEWDENYNIIRILKK